jgi:OFA family oxalate/formate antiporter-like MFS transporter
MNETTATVVDANVIAKKTMFYASAWPQLIIGIVCMVMIANMQYGWTFFVPEIQHKFGWDRASIQIAFTLFILFETWLVPIEGWFVDHYGPQIVVFVGGLACALGWTLNSYATTLGQFYTAQIITGIGAGAVYGTCIGNSLKWFPNRRGLAAGLTAAGFGAGSALTVIPIQSIIKNDGFQSAFLYFGLGQGVVICLIAYLMAVPSEQLRSGIKIHKSVNRIREFSTRDIIGPSRPWIIAILFTVLGGLTMWSLGLQFYIPLALAGTIMIVGGGIVWNKGEPVFTLMYLMFVIVGAGGLIVTANLAPISQDLKVGTIPVTLVWLTLPALTFAATIDRTLNGLTRPFFGWVSDQIGRENTMFIAFTLEGIGIFLLYQFGADPFWFVILSGMVFFAWGEIYSLFPATCTDTFGSKYATSNSGLLYTAKGTAALLVPYASTLQKNTGSWDAVFLMAAGLNIIAAFLAVGVLKHWRHKVIANQERRAITRVPE